MQASETVYLRLLMGSVMGACSHRWADTALLVLQLIRTRPRSCHKQELGRAKDHPPPPTPHRTQEKNLSSQDASVCITDPLKMPVSRLSCLWFGYSQCLLSTRNICLVSFCLFIVSRWQPSTLPAWLSSSQRAFYSLGWSAYPVSQTLLYDGTFFLP